ncbi:lipopolysaccharide biosynthesis protein [Mucilaginibacter lappiensis]
MSIFAYAMDGAKRLTMANAKETVKRKGWYYIPLLCLITSLLCNPNYTFTCRFRVTISVSFGILKGREQRPSTIFKKVANVIKNIRFT